MARGAHGTLHSTPPLISPAIWTTMATGRPREVHGIDNFVAKIPFQYREALMTSRHRLVPALWQMADWAGKSVGVVNWYSARPAEKLAHGVFVAEGIEDPAKTPDEAVYPPKWLERVRTVPLPRFLDYEQEMARIKDPRVERAYKQDLIVFSISLEILREKHPDLMMVYFQNVDVLSHGFWKYRWPMGLDHNFPVSRAERERYENVIEMHYELTDRMIGGLLSEASGYAVIVISDHGLGPTYPPKNIYPDLNKLLERMGYLAYEGKTCDRIVTYLADNGSLEVPPYRANNIFGICARLEAEAAGWKAQGLDQIDAAASADAFLSVHFNLKRPRDDKEDKERFTIMRDLAGALAPGGQRQDVLWRDTFAWNGQDFHKDARGIYINLREREPEGIVARKKYKGFRNQLIKDLRSLRTDGGRPLFKTVKANTDKPMMPDTVADPPDVIVLINREALVDNVAFRITGDPDPVPLAAIRWSYRDLSADHVPEGVFLISGEQASNFKRIDAKPLDITPTILWIMGLPLGADMKGKVLAEAFHENAAKRKPLYIQSWDRILEAGVKSEPVSMTPGMIDRMKAIGYIQDSGPREYTPPIDGSKEDGNTAD